MKKQTLFIISASTGCSCCCEDNHYRGFYKTYDDAERRRTYYHSPDSNYWPLASQYARRGRYSIDEVEVEDLGDGRWIVNDTIIHDLPIIEVNSDGTVSNNDDEQIYDLDY